MSLDKEFATEAAFSHHLNEWAPYIEQDLGIPYVWFYEDRMRISTVIEVDID